MKPYLDFSDLCVAVWLGAVLGALGLFDTKPRTRIIDDRGVVVKMADFR